MRKLHEHETKMVTITEHEFVCMRQRIDLLEGSVRHWKRQVAGASDSGRTLSADFVINRLRTVADGYEDGGHTHRAKMLRALAREFESLVESTARSTDALATQEASAMVGSVYLETELFIR